MGPGGTITKIEEEYVKGILKVDYICRITRLTDVLTNSSNAGFVIHEEVQRVKAKVIDFQIISSSNYKVVDPFAAFCAGNGETGSYEANPVLAELFSSNTFKTRIRQTKKYYPIA